MVSLVNGGPLVIHMNQATIIACLLLSSFLATAQEQLVDCRDQQVYWTVEIKGTLWMTQNLNLETRLSTGLSQEQLAEHPDLTGRYYHVFEVDTICPCGWRLPDAEDWINYFDYLATNYSDSGQIKLSVDDAHVAFMGYHESFDLFGQHNPIQLGSNGRVEGDQFYFYPDMADYWTKDPPNFNEGSRNNRPGLVHVIPDVHDGTTHIHLRADGFTNIHSHQHHLNPKKEKKLRKFMVRCVKAVVND